VAPQKKHGLVLPLTSPGELCHQLDHNVKALPAHFAHAARGAYQRDERAHVQRQVGLDALLKVGENHQPLDQGARLQLNARAVQGAD
jgi:hypothetical protein